MEFLRAIVDDDREKLLAWRNQPEVARFMFSEGEIAPEDHARWFAAARLDPTRVYWIIQHAGRDLGLASLADIDLDHRRCQFGIYLADATQRGRGLGTLAECELAAHVFGELALEKLGCEVLAFNERMIALQKSLGFAEEGRLRRHIRKGNEWHDVVCLGLLREEWERGRAEREVRLRAIRAKLASG